MPAEASPLRAADYSDRYDPEQDFDHWYTRLTARRVLRHLRPDDHVLEAGSATGLLTAELCGEGRRFLCLERSVSYAARARARGLPGVTVIEGMIEDFTGEEPFDHVLALNVLHELPNASAALARLLRGLRPAACCMSPCPTRTRCTGWRPGRPA
ncbi:class I SAM-dependent methyltransferase [Teichococcus aestuarii]|uniref:class I SAM-dependent methyltransferase n=1 Tax=Teichococcus aestuarii TaxID=568898 RepID=UPI00361D9F05